MGERGKLDSSACFKTAHLQKVVSAIADLIEAKALVQTWSNPHFLIQLHSSGFCLRDRLNFALLVDSPMCPLKLKPAEPSGSLELVLPLEWQGSKQ